MDQSFQENFWQSAKFVAIFIAILWIVEILDVFILGQALNQFGILPLHWSGLPGVVLWPFLHDGFIHLSSNTFPLLIMGTFIAARNGIGEYVKISVFITIASGLAVWLLAGMLGGDGFHIGASGLAFGYLGFLLLRGIVTKHPLDIMIAVFILFFYGSLIFGVLPIAPAYISWQGHLFGLLTGIAAAYWLVPNDSK